MFPDFVTETAKGGDFLKFMVPVVSVHHGRERCLSIIAGRAWWSRGAHTTTARKEENEKWSSERGQSEMSIQLPVMFFVLPIVLSSDFPTSEYRCDSMKPRRN